MTMFRALGLMSGTSMDGVDVALIQSDGEKQVRQGPSSFQPYSQGDRILLRQALEDARGLKRRNARPGALAAAEALVTLRHVEAVEAFLLEHGVAREALDIVGFHGQTVVHRPEKKLTVQIGDAKTLAMRLGLAVASDFRAADVAAGGHGAPLVPVYHRALVEAAGLPGLVGVLNLGGVANLTVLAQGAEPLACDTGPGNALIDDLLLERSGVAMDVDGAAAAQGKVHSAALAAMMLHPYFQKLPPKSLDRNDFSRAAVASLGVEDAAATLAAFTAESVAHLLLQLPQTPNEIIVCGGGAKNPVILRELAARTGARIRTADDAGWSADAMEAQAFAYLAIRTLKKLPITFPTTTGAPRPLPGGIIHRP